MFSRFFQIFCIDIGDHSEKHCMIYVKKFLYSDLGQNSENWNQSENFSITRFYVFFRKVKQLRLFGSRILIFFYRRFPVLGIQILPEV